MQYGNSDIKLMLFQKCLMHGRIFSRMLVAPALPFSTNQPYLRHMPVLTLMLSLPNRNKCLQHAENAFEQQCVRLKNFLNSQPIVNQTQALMFIGMYS